MSEKPKPPAPGTRGVGGYEWPPRQTRNGTARLKNWVEWFIKWVVVATVPIMFGFILRTEIHMARVKDFMEAGPRVAPVHLEAAIASHERTMRTEFIGREALDERFARIEALLQPMQRDLERIREDVEILKRQGR